MIDSTRKPTFALMVLFINSQKEDSQIKRISIPYITAICYSYLSQLELLITVKLPSTQIQREHDDASRKIG